ncbi:MAG: ABC transporter permease [bacterium]|nr:ABC transporter permease [bacterium]
MFSSLKQSIKSLFANPARTMLTTLGIVIGIATVIMVLSAGAGFRGFINDQISSLGSNTLVIATKVPPTTKNRAASNASGGPGAQNFNAVVAITSFKERDLEDIKRLPNVTGAYGIAIGQAVAGYRENKKSVLYAGTSADRFLIDQGTLREGRFFTEGENAGAAQVALLGSGIADDLFEQDPPVGKILRIGNLNFQVIGVYNSRGGPVGGDDDMLFMPLVTAQKKLLGIDHIARGVVQIADTDRGDITAEDIRGVLRQNHRITDSVKDDFTVATQADVLDTLNTVFNGITILLVAIAAISLIVGGVGIMNIMYVAVTERTAEIGLKKAVGATNMNILSEFLAESVLVTVLGGILGIGLGAFLAWIVSVVAISSGMSWHFIVPLYAIAIGVGVSAIIGISFGVLPARSASHLDPIEALRYE